ncbi:hypothetical protein B4135_0746 [Caldibacillus debilis]|uniref:Uncharacterized protein n=1 Tax=Caldibacillus debilis TaxID=301148 RepID=A0A150M5F8_9BACI|nr:hypothetical protein B4135_0746 [Caldibacillus debilis]
MCPFGAWRFFGFFISFYEGNGKNRTFCGRSRFSQSRHKGLSTPIYIERKGR